MTGFLRVRYGRDVDFTNFCPIRQQLMSNFVCAVRLRLSIGTVKNSGVGFDIGVV